MIGAAGAAIGAVRGALYGKRKPKRGKPGKRPRRGGPFGGSRRPKRRPTRGTPRRRPTRGGPFGRPKLRPHVKPSPTRNKPRFKKAVQPSKSKKRKFKTGGRGAQSLVLSKNPRFKKQREQRIENSRRKAAKNIERKLAERAGREKAAKSKPKGWLSEMNRYKSKGGSTKKRGGPFGRFKKPAVQPSRGRKGGSTKKKGGWLSGMRKGKARPKYKGKLRMGLFGSHRRNGKLKK